MAEVATGSVRIGESSIGKDVRPFVIAEVSANHAGSKQMALEIVGAASEAGADAVKFQHYTPDTITVRSDHPDFLVRGGTLWDGRQLFDLYAEAMTPWEWTDDLVAEARRLGLVWLSTPFDNSAVDFLEQYSPPAYKVASFELTDLPLIRYVASKRRPLVMSTGMATADEIDAGFAAATTAGADGVVLLRCNSGYPANPGEMDLRAIAAMAERWQVPIGLSDHTRTNAAAIAAVALGAMVIEKHLTLRRSDGGPDAEFSLEPDEFASLVRDVHDAHQALGDVRFGPSHSELPSTKFRRSLRASRDIAAGEVLDSTNVRSMRPAGGLPPDDMGRITARRARTAIQAGWPITEDCLG